jgi:CTP:molybdopterin cytidylyltransferase MocA
VTGGAERAEGRRGAGRAARSVGGGAVAGLVLAAGAGRRFGAGPPKQLAELDGRPLLEHVLAAATAVLDRVVVVVGARAEEVLAGVELHGAEPVVCPEWAEGQAASLRCGVRALAGAERVLVLVGDQPRVDAALVARLAREPPGSRAAHDGVPGHPAVLGPAELARVPELRGDRGLRDLVAWRLVEAGVPLTDLDTPDDLEAIRREARAVL